MKRLSSTRQPFLIFVKLDFGMKIIQPSDYITTFWEGGSTKQLYNYPENSNFKLRDFGFRISLASVEVETSEFTNFQNFQRILIPLTGENIQLNFEKNDENTSELTVNPYEIVRFDGGWKTKSKGVYKDFNCIFSNHWIADVEVIENSTMKKEVTLLSNQWGLFFSVVGEFKVMDQLVKGHELGVVNQEEKKVRIESISNNGVLIVIRLKEK